MTGILARDRDGKKQDSVPPGVANGGVMLLSGQKPIGEQDAGRRRGELRI
jgi:hypothetical protein